MKRWIDWVFILPRYRLHPGCSLRALAFFTSSDENNISIHFFFCPVRKTNSVRGWSASRLVVVYLPMVCVFVQFPLLISYHCRGNIELRRVMVAIWGLTFFFSPFFFLLLFGIG